MADSRAVADFKAVALGGGHGLFNTLTALRSLTRDVTAVVTVADDGGSSGRLRSELDLIPPGDLRMALAALMAAPAVLEELADDPAAAERHAFWTRVLQHRIGGSGALAGHPVGNLLLSGVEELSGDIVVALEKLVDLFGIDGRVLPMSTVPLVIEADVTGLEEDPRISRVIRGQVAVATTPGTVRRVRLSPDAPQACPQAVAALNEADVVTVGPGSWFSSVIPHVLVPGQLAALRDTPARKMLFVNLATEPGETPGYSLERHLHVLHAHADSVRFDDVIVDAGSVPAGREREHLERAAAKLGAELRVHDLAADGQPAHDPVKAAATVRRLMSGNEER